MITDTEKSENEILEIKLTLWQQKITDLYFHFVLLWKAFNLDAGLIAQATLKSKQRRKAHQRPASWLPLEVPVPWSGSSWPSPVSHFLPDPVSSPHLLIDMLQPWRVTYNFTNSLDGVPPPCLSTYFTPLHLEWSSHLVLTTLSSWKTPVHPLGFYSALTSSCQIFPDSTSLSHITMTLSLVRTSPSTVITCFHLCTLHFCALYLLGLPQYVM